MELADETGALRWPAPGRRPSASTAIQTTTTNGRDPQACLADVPDRIHVHRTNRLDAPRPWNRHALAGAAKRATRVDTLAPIAKLPGATADLPGQIVWKDDTFDHGGIVTIRIGDDETIASATDEGTDSLRTVIRDLRPSRGGIRAFLANSQVEPDAIERILADEAET